MRSLQTSWARPTDRTWGARITSSRTRVRHFRARFEIMQNRDAHRLRTIPWGGAPTSGDSPLCAWFWGVNLAGSLAGSLAGGRWAMAVGTGRDVLAAASMRVTCSDTVACMHLVGSPANREHYPPRSVLRSVAPIVPDPLSRSPLEVEPFNLNRRSDSVKILSELCSYKVHHRQSSIIRSRPGRLTPEPPWPAPNCYSARHAMHSMCATALTAPMCAW